MHYLLFISIQLILIVLANEGVMYHFVECKLIIEDLEDGLASDLTEYCFEVNQFEASSRSKLALEAF